MISYSRVEDALGYLAKTDYSEAELRAEVEGNKKALDAKFKILAAYSGKKTVLDKEAYAYKHEEYLAAEAAYLRSLTEHGAIKNERSRNVLVIDVGRSINAARNKGQNV